MKTIITLTLAAALTAGTFRTFAQSDDPLAALMKRRALEEQQLGGGQPATTDATTPTPDGQTPTPSPAVTELAVEISTNAPTDLIATGSSTNGIMMNFTDAPLALVLKYLSGAAGFIIQSDTQVRGNVTVNGGTNYVTKDQAVEILNTALARNNLAAIRNGQILTIVSKGDRGNNYQVKIWDGNPASIPNNAEMVTQIVPIRFVEAAQLLRDLSSFISSSATVVANEAGNSIVITDTQANIRHLTEIIKAIDSSAEGETQVRVFPLKYANPTDIATLLSGIFPNDSSGSSNPIRFGGGGGRGGGGPGGGFAALFGGAQNTTSGSQARIKKQTQVIAVADLRTQSVVVTASKDLMEQIDEMIKRLDIGSPRDQKVNVAHIKLGGDSQQILQVLQSMFPASSTSRSSSSSSSTANSALMQRAQNAATTQGTSSGTSTTTIGGGTTGGGRGGISLP